MSSTRDLFRLVKFEHTLFALPFAFVGAIAAGAGWPSPQTVLLILGAMVGARTSAMALNRLIDLPLDAKNPRTSKWELPSGKVRKRDAWGLVFGGLVLLGFCARLLNPLDEDLPLALRLAPLAVALLALYPYTKRWGWWCHLWLGAVLACAPAGGWIAVAGGWGDALWWIVVGIMFWVAGFDILYSLQDLPFDKENNLKSIPVFWGETKAFVIARTFHAFALLGFVGFGGVVGWGIAWWLGCGIAGALLVYQHRIVGPRNLERLDAAFFAANGWLSIVLGVAAWLAAQ